MTTDAKIGLWLGVVYLVVIYFVVHSLPNSLHVDYTCYRNRRFGFELEYPACWIADLPPENGDGNTFRDSHNPTVFISVAGCLNVGDDDSYMRIERLEKWNSEDPEHLLISKEILERPLWRTNYGDPENDQIVGKIIGYKVVYTFKEQGKSLTRIILAMEQDIQVYFLVCQAPSDLFFEYSELFSHVCESFRIYIIETAQILASKKSLPCLPSIVRNSV